MKKLPWILIVLLAIACIVVWFRPHEQPPAEVRVETKIKTVVRVDTMLISAPMAVFWRFVPDDTTRIGDTLLHRRQVVYSDSSYRAVVSGYVDPRLDSLQIFPRTVYQTVTNDVRSEEHTSELQSRLHLVCRLLLEKNKQKEMNKIVFFISSYHCHKL